MVQVGTLNGRALLKRCCGKKLQRIKTAFKIDDSYSFAVRRGY